MEVRTGDKKAGAAGKVSRGKEAGAAVDTSVAAMAADEISSGAMAADEKEILTSFLEQYISLTRTIETLKRRLGRFDAEMISSGTREEPVNFVVRKEEIETKLSKKSEKACEKMIDIINVLDFLDDDSDAKAILEYKYIDDLSWSQITKAYRCSKSSCVNYWRQGLDALLKIQEVRRILSEYSNKKCII